MDGFPKSLSDTCRDCTFSSFHLQRQPYVEILSGSPHGSSHQAVPALLTRPRAVQRAPLAPPRLQMEEDWPEEARAEVRSGWCDALFCFFLVELLEEQMGEMRCKESSGILNEPVKPCM